MKLNALFLAFLTVFSPAILAMDTEFTPTSVGSEDICYSCHTLAKNVPQNKRYISNCCASFICKIDAKPLLAAVKKIKENNKDIKTRLRDNFPTVDNAKLVRMYQEGKTHNTIRCRKCSKKLSISEAFLQKPVTSKPSLKLRDTEGKDFELSPEESEAFLQCESLKMQGDPLSSNGLIDYSDKKRSFIKQNLITQLAQFIMDPVKEIKQINLELFELANYVLAPNNVLYLMANELWPLMQELNGDTPQVKKYKETLRGLAKPHLASPKQLAQYIQYSHHGKLFRNIKKWSEECQAYAFDLSCNTISAHLRNGGWYQDENNHWYKIYPFYTVDGIQQLCDPKDKLYYINVSGHRIEKVSGNILQAMKEATDANLKINFDNNPIAAIDQSFYQEVAKKRAATNRFSFSFEHSNLTDEQKEEIKKKFYYASTPIPQRFLGEITSTCLAVGAGCLGSTLAVHYLSHKAPVVTNTTSTIASGIIGAAIGGIATSEIHPVFSCIMGAMTGAIGIGLGASCVHDYKTVTTPTHLFTIPLGGYAGLKLMNYAALKLARKTHPNISSDIIWNSSYNIKF